MAGAGDDGLEPERGIARTRKRHQPIPQASKMVASWTMGSSTLVIIGITAANCPIWISYYLLAFNGHKMQTFNVHVAGCWNGDDARGGVGVYWGQNDARYASDYLSTPEIKISSISRNISARCGNAVTDADSAGLDVGTPPSSVSRALTLQ